MIDKWRKGNMKWTRQFRWSQSFISPNFRHLLPCFCPVFYFNLIVEKVFHLYGIQIWKTNMALVIDCFLFLLILNESSVNIIRLIEKYYKICLLLFLKTKKHQAENILLKKKSRTTEYNFLWRDVSRTFSQTYLYTEQAFAASRSYKC